MLPQKQVRSKLLIELDVMGEKHNLAERRERLSWSSSLPSLVRRTKQPPCSHPPMGIVSFQPLFILAGNALVSCSFNHVTWTIPTAYILIYLRFTPHAADRLTFVKLKLCMAFPYSNVYCSFSLSIRSNQNFTWPSRISIKHLTDLSLPSYRVYNQVLLIFPIKPL